MEHVVFIETQAKELQNLFSGEKTMKFAAFSTCIDTTCSAMTNNFREGVE